MNRIRRIKQWEKVPDPIYRVWRAESVLNFVSGSGDPPYWSSVGEHEKDEAVSFNFMGELSEIPLRHLIPMDVARQAVRDFVQTGKLSHKVTWEES